MGLKEVERRVCSYYFSFRLLYGKQDDLNAVTDLQDDKGIDTLHSSYLSGNIYIANNLKRSEKSRNCDGFKVPFSLYFLNSERRRNNF